MSAVNLRKGKNALDVFKNMKELLDLVGNLPLRYANLESQNREVVDIATSSFT